MAVRSCSCVSVKLPYVLIRNNTTTQLFQVSLGELVNSWQGDICADRVFANHKSSQMYAIRKNRVLLLTPPSFFDEVGHLPGCASSVCFVITHDKVVWWYTNGNILCFRTGMGDYRRPQKVTSIGDDVISVSTNEGVIEIATTPSGKKYFYFTSDGMATELVECQVLCHSPSVLQYSVNSGIGADVFSVRGDLIGRVEISGGEVGIISAITEGNIGVCVFTTEWRGTSAICIFEKTKRVSEDGNYYGKLLWSGGTNGIVRQLFTDQRFVYAYSVSSGGADVIHVFEATGNYVKSLLLTPAGFKAYNCESLSRSQEIVMRIRDGFAYIPVAEEKDSPYLFSLLTSPFADFCRGVIYDVEWLPSAPTMLFSSTGV